MVKIEAIEAENNHEIPTYNLVAYYTRRFSI